MAEFFRVLELVHLLQVMHEIPERRWLLGEESLVLGLSGEHGLVAVVLDHPFDDRVT